jgi:hypothetical protein
LFVGKSWVSEFRIRDHAREQTVALKYDFRVEAFEEVVTPAGAFKAFRVRRDGPDDRYIVWFNPELAIEVKRVWERFSGHRLGAGERDGTHVSQHQEIVGIRADAWAGSRVLAEALKPRRTSQCSGPGARVARLPAADRGVSRHDG